MKITKKEILSQVENTKIVSMEIDAPLIAGKAKPGQFVVLIVKAEGERIPLTVVKTNKKSRTINLIFQELGFTTKLLGNLKVGDSLYSIVGPLGNSTEIKHYGKVIIIGGGVGIAEIYPVAKALKAAGNRVVTILGARTKDLLILEKELKAVSEELHIATDDGSYGKKGFVTDVLDELLTQHAARSTQHDLVYAVGPIPMMKLVSSITKGFNVKTIVSLNALMVDGTGMCGSCRVTVGGEMKFSCVDGPEFDGHLVDWEELGKRNNIYRDKEKHICKLKKI